MTLTVENLSDLQEKIAANFGKPLDAVRIGTASEEFAPDARRGCYYVSFLVAGEPKTYCADVWFDSCSGELDWCF